MRDSGRQDEIANYVIEKGEVRIEELIAHFGVSRMTIHRSIDRLASKGVLRKLHGAVSAQPSGIYESLFRYRQSVAPREKAALARAALAHISPGQVVMLDDSTTAAALAPLLPNVAPLTVVTNSVEAVAALKDRDEIDVICAGGHYHRTYNAYLGHMCLAAITALRANLFLCSASAIDGTTAFIQDQQVVGVKQAMMAASSHRILIADHTKFGKGALHVFESLSAFDLVLVDDGLDADTLRRLKEAHIPLQIVRTQT